MDTVAGLAADDHGVVGRDDELGAVGQLVDSLRGGVGGALLFLGEPGAGKTVLLQHAAALARSGRLSVLVSQGLEGEVHIPYASLHRLLHPMVGGVERLLEPGDAAVLGDALRMPPVTGIDRTAVAAATLRLLHGLAGERPVLLVVDDLHWLDAESRAVLAFLIGRTEPAAIGLVGASRDEAVIHELPDLPVRRLDGLDPPAVAELLATVAAAPTPAVVRRSLAAATRGNPRALVEVAGLLTADQLRGATVIPEPVPIGTSTEWAYAGPIRDLPPLARRVLLLAAADPALDAASLARAAERTGRQPGRARRRRGRRTDHSGHRRGDVRPPAHPGRRLPLRVLARPPHRPRGHRRGLPGPGGAAPGRGRVGARRVARGRAERIRRPGRR